MKNIYKYGLIFLSSLALTSCGSFMVSKAEASENVSTYLVLSSVGLYEGNKGQDYADLYIENAIRFDAPVGTALPGKDKVTSIASSIGVFSSWVRYDGEGAPSKYSEVPNEKGAILYANFINSNLSLSSLALTGAPTKTAYNLDEGENTFDSTGVTVTATYSDSSTADVTGSVLWATLVSGATSVVGTYTYNGVSKTVTVIGLTVTGDDNSKVYLATGGSSLWGKDGAWFAAYCWNASDNLFYKLTADGNYYSASIDTSTYTNVIFIRFAPTATEMSWNDESTNIWNKTGDLSFDGNCFTITDWSTGSWSNI